MPDFAPIPARAGSALRLSFIVQNGATYETGATFTVRLSKNGAGNQSTTGVTITEVDSVNNPGEYAVAIAASAFVAGAGTYLLNIHRTSDASYRYSFLITVTADGVAGSTGTASFTATAANGRVTDGASAITGARVFVRDSAGATVAILTTTATGVWGPVYLEDGTYTAYAQKAGYTQATGTITVSAGVATGPGADIALTAISATSSLLFSELIAYARDAAMSATGTLSEARIKRAINLAADMLAKERDWNWYSRRTWVSVVAPYSTGTIALTEGSAVVTLTGGTFPTWAASGKLCVGGLTIDVLTRDSTTQLTLKAAWGAASVTGQGYVLMQDEYDLPDDFFRLVKVYPGQSWGWGGDPVTPELFHDALNSVVQGQQRPSLFALARGKLLLYPYPNVAANLQLLYRARPAPMTSVSDTADWDVAHVELLYRAIDYQIAVQFGRSTMGEPDACYARYKEALTRAATTELEQAKLPSPIDMATPFRSRNNPWTRR